MSAVAEQLLCAWLAWLRPRPSVTRPPQPSGWYGTCRSTWTISTCRLSSETSWRGASPGTPRPGPPPQSSWVRGGTSWAPVTRRDVAETDARALMLRWMQESI